MKKAMFLGLLALLMTGFSPLAAQDQSGATLAEQIAMVSSNIMDGSIGCVERMVATGTSDKNARNYCLKVTNKVTKVVSDMSDDVSGAADANRPLVVGYGGYGYGGYGYSRSYGYGYNRPIARRTVFVRQAPAPRPAPPPRQAPPPRTPPPARPAPPVL